MKNLGGTPGSVWRWWRSVKAHHPVLRGAIVWTVFWSVSIAAIAWVYSPGGLADPDRDLKSPKRGIGAPVCVNGCPADQEDSPTDTTIASAETVTPSGRRGGPTTAEPTTSASPLGLPTASPPPLPALSIAIVDEWLDAGRRYATYEVVLSPKQVLDDVRIEAHVPAGMIRVECSEQAGARICIDGSSGSDETHGFSEQTGRIAPPATFNRRWHVRVVTTVEADERIANHAHATWAGKVVRSADAVYTVPAIVAT